MVGGWSWKERQYGLQRLQYNGKPTFEMVAIRAKPDGFEIEFTEPLEPGSVHDAKNITIQQWWYRSTADYGGPKIDLENLPITAATLSKDGRKIYLKIPQLKKEHVIYFRLPDDLRSAPGRTLWSSEAWYTLNNIPN
jgi:cytochrome c